MFAVTMQVTFEYLSEKRSPCAQIYENVFLIFFNVAKSNVRTGANCEYHTTKDTIKSLYVIKS